MCVHTFQVAWKAYVYLGEKGFFTGANVPLTALRVKWHKRRGLGDEGWEMGVGDRSDSQPPTPTLYPPLFIARHSCSGRIGVSVTRTPVASRTALASAAAPAVIGG